jgi:DNA helicase-2/ATP-dependent DNA helicase PcrA
MLFGSTLYNPPSRFLDEIPETLVDVVDGNRRASRRSGGGDGSWGRGLGSSKDPIVEQALRSSGPRPSGAESLGLKVGDDVRHAKFGEGVIIDLEGVGDKAEATVRFPEIGEKRLLLSWSPLEKIG